MSAGTLLISELKCPFTELGENQGQNRFKNLKYLL